MGGLFSSTKGCQVLVSRKVDYIDSITHQRKSGALDKGAVHGTIVGTDASGKEGPITAVFSRLTCSNWGHSEDEVAWEIVQNAMEMASAIALQDDILDCQWHGVNGQNTLQNLLGCRNLGEAGESILHLVANLEDLVAHENTVNYIPVPAKVFGDLHGQFRDLLLMLHNYGWPSKSGPKFVFNGDWVDRGAHQLETICLVYALKLAFPDTVWLNRGNHEDGSQNQHMGKEGFTHACIQTLGQDVGERVFMAFANSYGYLPLATVLGENILVVHGGIGDGCWDLRYLESVRRPIQHDQMTEDQVVYNVLWSDPIDEDQHKFGAHPAWSRDHRGLVKSFGADITKMFCQRNGIQMIIRSHEFRTGGDGYECMHGEHLMRVFSARDYGKGKCMNDGSILSVTMSKGKMIVRPQMLKSLAKQAAQAHGNHQRPGVNYANGNQQQYNQRPMPARY